MRKLHLKCALKQNGIRKRRHMHLIELALLKIKSPAVIQYAQFLRCKLIEFSIYIFKDDIKVKNFTSMVALIGGHLVDMMSIPMKLTNLTMLNNSFNYIQKCCTQRIMNWCPVSSPKVFMLTLLLLSLLVNTTP